MMIDIDPGLGASNQCRCRSETALRGGIERNRHIEILRLAQRRLEKFAAGQETVFLEETVFIPDHDRLPELRERKPQTELAAERIAIWPDMTEHGKTLPRTQDQIGRASCRERV